MQTLRAYMEANCWLAVTAGCSVATALDAFERAGAPVDSPEALKGWQEAAFNPNDLHRVVRAKLIDALAGRRVWRPLPTGRHPGAVDEIPPSCLVGARHDDEALRIRVLARYCGDKRSVHDMALIEDVTEQRVLAILFAEGIDPKRPKPKLVRQKAPEPVTPDNVVHAERVQEFRRIFGRKPRRAGW